MPEVFFAGQTGIRTYREWPARTAISFADAAVLFRARTAIIGIAFRYFNAHTAITEPAVAGTTSFDALTAITAPSSILCPARTTIMRRFALFLDGATTIE